MSLYQWLTNREYGNAPRMGDGNLILQRTYNSMKMFHVHEFNQKVEDSVGAVFNLEFNADGNVLVAACEKKAIVLFDVISRQQTFKIPNAHTDNVNCIKFLDDRLFASGSDDETVALWDLRYLKEKLRVLHGHSNWVKNIEYSPKDKLLVTSGFDGSIFTWDIKSQTEQGLISQRVFQTSGLMRCRISPDGEKLVFSTSGGYLMIIHHLDLMTLHKDLCGFRPSMYRLMQMGDQYIPQAAKYAHVFSKSQKQNRVEFVTDFPENDDAEMIGALQIHPQGLCILSRNTSCNEQSEWTCVHDINEEPDDDIDIDTTEEPLSKRKRHSTNDSDDDLERVADSENNDLLRNSQPNDFYRANRLLVFRNARNLGTRFALARTLPPLPPINSNQNGRPEAFIPDIWAAEVTVQERAVRQNRARNSTAVTGYNFVYAISSGVLPVRTGTSRVESDTDAATTDNEPSPRSDSSGSSSSSETPLPFERLHLRPIRLTQQRSASLRERSILKNAQKLMFYTQETNQDRGFIKEPCFSADGRIVCSPYGTGLRLLAYTKDCSEYPRYQMFDDVKGNPRELVEVAKITNHDEVVYCTKFSPREPLLVSGCQAGRVLWYHPNL